ncbi:MAG: hypothetical protein N2260_10825 [Syntrophobacterales bacterium]|nr:hypothetical protein [Syntrophobacterales bacterium]
MNRKTEEKLFEILRRIYENRQEIKLDDKWRRILMKQVVEITEKSVQLVGISPWMFKISAQLRFGILIVLLLSLATLVVTHHQLGFDLISLAFEFEQEIFNL